MRTVRMHHIAQSCRPEDWTAFVQMATGHYAWADGVEQLVPWGGDRAHQHDADIVRDDTQCKALGMLAMAGYIYTSTLHPTHARHLLFRHRLMEAFSQPAIVAEINGAISGAIPLPAHGCPNIDAFAKIAELVPLVDFRPAIAAHASERIRDEMLAHIDEARRYKPHPRAAKLELAAAQLTPEGYAMVLEAMAPGYAWNDGLKPTAREQRDIERTAADLIDDMPIGEPWPVDPTGRTISLPPIIADCHLGEAIRSGRLGELLAARLDHRNPAIRIAIVHKLAGAVPPGARALIANVAASDPDKRVRAEAGLAGARMDARTRTAAPTASATDH